MCSCPSKKESFLCLYITCLKYATQLVLDVLAFNINADTDTLSCQVRFSSKSLLFSSNSQNVEGPRISLGDRNISKYINFASALTAFSVYLPMDSHIIKIKKVLKKKEFTKEPMPGRKECMEWGKGQDHLPYFPGNSNSCFAIGIYRCVEQTGLMKCRCRVRL